MTTSINSLNSTTSELQVNSNPVMRFGDQGAVLLPKASATPSSNGDMVFQLTSNTSLVIKVKGSDGTVRSTTLTLA